VSAFEAAARAAAEIGGDAERASALKQAVDLYRGPFLPGFYDDWAIMERERLEQVYIEVLNRLPGALAEAGDLGSAIDYAHRRVAADSLSEEAHCELIGLLVKAEQFDAARSRFVEMERIFRDELGIAAPSVARALVAGLPAGPSRKNSGAVVETPAPCPCAAARSGSDRAAGHIGGAASPALSHTVLRSRVGALHAPVSALDSRHAACHSHRTWRRGKDAPCRGDRACAGRLV
jgi:Response regulator containing CheY-like receiver and SARP domains